MFSLILSPDYAVFSIALVIMLGIGAIEAVGLGFGHLDLDNDIGTDVNGPGVLDWLGLKTGLPVLIWLTSLLGCFTLTGFAIQQIATAITGAPLHWALASGIALFVGGIANSFASTLLARIMPEYESTVIDTEDLLMRRATVVEGASRRGHPARAKVVDQHGQAHYVMVEPHHDADVVGQGESALLVRRQGPTFFVQPDLDTPFRPL
ncbi:OB-fold-containig protein [Sphingobium sp. CECT 9361]|uniref:OB-fold-containig protein n=1 Tax=Sphingobium sp. CECT 9361 TaxID=2845384 RepID=UPI001E29185C|nr:OB-fold-containig protein [Sphingobium sp. CECT 9361]CAH0356821.1 Inner membrane protein YqiJ [Sphingobium sp. CECT 9361]